MTPAARFLRARRRVAVLAALAIVAAVYITFRGVALESAYEVRGVFTTSNQLRKDGAVRIAGIDVGRVEGIEAGPDGTSVVTLHIDDRSVPIRRDARLEIKPRLALEGNYYVAVRPGSPGTEELESGATIPVAQTAGPVQLDQVLGVFTKATRDALSSAARELATGVAGPGAAGLRRTARELDHSLADITAVADGLRGERTGDLTDAVLATGDFTGQLSDSPPALADFVTHFNRTFAALSADTAALRRTIRAVDDVLTVAPNRLRRVDAALPELTRFATTLEPALRQAPPTLRRLNAMLGQLNPLMRPQELAGLVADLRPVTSTLPQLNRRLTALFPHLQSAMTCISRNVVPTLNTPIQDGPHTTGQPPWLELLHLAANLSSGSAGSDGNGTTIRLGVTESEQGVRATIPGLGPIVGAGSPVGMAPTWLGDGVEPPYRPDQKCTEQDLPKLNSRYGEGVPGFQPVENPRGGPDAAGLRRILRALAERKPNAVMRHLLALPTISKLLEGLDRERRATRRRPSPRRLAPPRRPATTPPAGKLKPRLPLPGLLDEVLKTTTPPLDRVDKSVAEVLGDLLPKLLEDRRGGSR